VLLRQQSLLNSPLPHDSQFQALTTTHNVAHPDGHRLLTLYELAILQGFPMTYNWAADGSICLTDARRMLGNAVPPKFFRPFVEQILRQLKKSDARKARAAQEQETIVLD
jgi:site-specific DNA-cytosine methylase